MNPDLISQAIVRLFETEYFYAEIICQMDRYISRRVPTAGVRIKDNIELFINPDFFESLTVLERVAILKHEAQHILRDHIGRSKGISPEIYDKAADEVDKAIYDLKHKTLNIAADCAINGTLKNLPEGCVYPKNFDLEDGNTMEWYLNNLKNNQKAKDYMEIDDHSLWSESDGDKHILREKVRQAIQKAAGRTRGAGKMTSENELLVSTLSKNTRDWKSDLRRFVAKSAEFVIESSKKKRNRRYGIMFPGTVKYETLHIGVAIDTSGSISDEQLIQFMSEIANISKYARVTVAEADSEVKNHYRFDPKKKYSVKGRGGTAYQPAFDFFNKEKDIDGVIYFGDMDTYDSEEIKKPKYPVLWAIVGNQEPPVNWGSKTRIET